LVFDMHNEYGYSAVKESSEGSRGFVKGLKQLFGNKVALFSLDPESTRARGVNPDHEVYISYDQVQVEDIAILQDELRLNPTAIESAYLLYTMYRRQWLRHLLSKDGEEIKELAEQIGAHKESLAALHRKLKRFEHFPFMVHALRGGDAIDRMLTSSPGESTKSTWRKASAISPPNAPRTSPDSWYWYWKRPISS